MRPSPQSRPALLLVLVLVLPAFTAAAQEKEPKAHEVKKGENLYRIGKKYGCSAEEIFAANLDRLESIKKVFPGQELLIPGHCTGEKVPVGKGKGKNLSERRGKCRNCRWKAKHINHRKLKAEMKRLGFKAPKDFRALVVKTVLTKDKKGILRHEVYDYGGKASNRGGWNPASTIKLFSGVSAIERIRELGFSPKAKVTFHYKGGDKTYTVEDLFEEAVHLSKNIPHNRLVQLAGFDHLNGPKGTLKRAGLEHSYVMRAYEASNWEAEGHSRRLNSSPAITLKEGKKAKKIRAKTSRRKYSCSSAACTSLSDLAKMMCTVMLHEQLPHAGRLRLGRGDSQGKHLLFLRRKLNRRRMRKKDPVWDVLERHFIPKAERDTPRKGGYQLFRKAGFSYDWLSENMYIYTPKGRVRWIVSMAGYPGRDSLTDAADIIARIIKEDRL